MSGRHYYRRGLYRNGCGCSFWLVMLLAILACRHRAMPGEYVQHVETQYGVVPVLNAPRLTSDDRATIREEIDTGYRRARDLHGLELRPADFSIEWVEHHEEYAGCLRPWDYNLLWTLPDWAALDHEVIHWLCYRGGDDESRCFCIDHGPECRPQR